MIQAEVINLYKGKIPFLFTFNVSLSWKPQKWFVVGEMCLILLPYSKSCGYTAFVINNKMSIITENNVRYVICHDCEPEFWGNAKCIVISKDLGSGTCKVLYDDVINQILNSKE